MAGYIGGNIFSWFVWGLLLIGIIWHVCAQESLLTTESEG